MPQPNVSLINHPEKYESPVDSKVSLATTETANDWFYGTEELLDALPRAWTRSLLYFLIIFIGLVLPWSMLSKIDETGAARGKLQPKGTTQRLDSQASGAVINVHVKKGEHVKAGQILLELESDVLKTDLQQTQSRLEGQKNRLSQLQLLQNQLKLSIAAQEQQNQSQALEKQAQFHQSQQNLDARKSNYHIQKLEKLALVEQAKQNISTTQTGVKLTKSRWQRDVQEVERYRQLLKNGAIPQIKVIELEKIAEESQRLYEQAQADLLQAQLRFQEEQNRYQGIITQAQADIEQAKLRVQEQKSSYESVINAGKLALLKHQEQLKDWQTQITSLHSEIAQTGSQIQSLQLQIMQRQVRSPVNGIIFDLPIEKPGSVLQPGQKVAEIAPDNTPFVLRAKMPTQHSGFLKIGMPVKLKFDAYPFQEYGVVTGKVTWMSPDSEIQQTPQGNLETFELEVSLNQAYIQNGKQQITLTPGQTATAEVITRQRRLIDFVLDPFKQLQKGGLKL